MLVGSSSSSPGIPAMPDSSQPLRVLPGSPRWSSMFCFPEEFLECGLSRATFELLDMVGCWSNDPQ